MPTTEIELRTRVIAIQTRYHLGDFVPAGTPRAVESATLQVVGSPVPHAFEVPAAWLTPLLPGGASAPARDLVGREIGLLATLRPLAEPEPEPGPGPEPAAAVPAPELPADSPPGVAPG